MLSDKERQNIIDDINKLMKNKDDKYFNKLAEVASFRIKPEQMRLIAAYFSMIKSELSVQMRYAELKLRGRGFTEEEIDSIFKIKDMTLEEMEEFKSLTGGQQKFIEQAARVSKGTFKPALKKHITYEVCQELYKKTRSQKEVARILGVHVQTVRNRLKGGESKQ